MTVPEFCARANRAGFRIVDVSAQYRTGQHQAEHQKCKIDLGVFRGSDDFVSGSLCVMREIRDALNEILGEE